MAGGSPEEAAVSISGQGCCIWRWVQKPGEGQLGGAPMVCPTHVQAPERPCGRRGVGRATQSAWQSAEVSLASVWRLDTWTGQRWTSGV